MWWYKILLKSQYKCIIKYLLQLVKIVSSIYFDLKLEIYTVYLECGKGIRVRCFFIKLIKPS